VERLDGEYRKVRKALEFVMPLLENMDEGLRKQILEKRKETNHCRSRYPLKTTIRHNIRLEIRR
jgi:hypothetical protein